MITLGIVAEEGVAGKADPREATGGRKHCGCSEMSGHASKRPRPLNPQRGSQWERRLSVRVRLDKVGALPFGPLPKVWSLAPCLVSFALFTTVLGLLSGPCTCCSLISVLSDDICLSSCFTFLSSSLPSYMFTFMTVLILLGGTFCL